MSNDSSDEEEENLGSLTSIYASVLCAPQSLSDTPPGTPPPFPDDLEPVTNGETTPPRSQTQDTKPENTSFFRSLHANAKRVVGNMKSSAVSSTSSSSSG